MNLTGSKVTLKAIQEEDLRFLMDLHNDPVTGQTIGGWAAPVSYRQQKEWFESIGKNPNVLRFSVWENNGDKLIGSCSLADIDTRNRTAEVHCRLDDKETRKGSGTDAVYLLLKLAFDFLDLAGVQATHLEENTRSAKLVKKLGFTQDGVLRARVFKFGQRHNMAYHFITNDEFVETKRRYEDGEI